jgi:hypothetical protein
MMLRYRQDASRPVVTIEDVDVDEVKARFLHYVESCLAGIEVADLSGDDLDVLQNLSGGKYRLPKSTVDALGLLPRSTYADALQSGIFAVRQLEDAELVAVG